MAAALLLCLFMFLNLFKCSPVPASFFPIYELCYKAQKTARNQGFFPATLQKTKPKVAYNTRTWQLCPRHERKLQRPCRPPHPAQRLFTRGAASGGTEVGITTKAQMTPHFSFVHRNESWNNSFILHYWQRTILTRTLVVCSNASISCHCLSSEMKTDI